MTVRGWCPSLPEPMLSGDGFLSRVKPRAARFTAAEARLIAAQAARHGNGAIGLTQRANLQPRGFSRASATIFAEAMVAAGLAEADPAVERGRNLLAPPLLGWDSTIAPGTAALVAALAAAMAEWPALPAKFGVLVDGGGALGLASESADLRLRLVGDAVEIRLGGGDAVARCAPGQAVAAATRLAWAFAELSPARRMHQAVAAHGTAAILAKAGLAKAELVSQPDGARPPPPPVVVGALPGGVLGVAPPFGQIGAEQLAALAGLAERLGDGTLRVTPWRALLLPGVADAAAVARLGLIVAPGDPRLRIVACTGTPGCASAAIDTRAVAARLAQAWAMKAGTGAMEAGPAGAAPDKGRADPRPRGARPAGLLHVSGCAKGCAHPGVAPVTLVGHAHGCGIVRDGRAGDTPDATDLTLEEALAVLENP